MNGYRASSFHLGEGPRPSRPAPPVGASDTPDGQDLWLASGEVGLAPHVTVAHVDSQSWWFLGGAPITSRRPGAVCLLKLGAGDINRDALAMGARDRLAATGGAAAPPDALQEFRLFTLLSVLWPPSTVPLLLLGCALRRYCVRREARSSVVNAGSAFVGVVSPTLSTWLSAEAIPRPTPQDPLAGVRDGRAIPAPLRLGHPLEVTQLPVLIHNGPVRGHVVQ